MPNLFSFLGYVIFFWSNENNEPIHVHVCKGVLTPILLKYGLRKIGDCMLVHNNSQIPQHDLRKIYKAIQYNFFYITAKWKERFGDTEIKFYC